MKAAPAGHNATTTRRESPVPSSSVSHNPIADSVESVEKARDICSPQDMFDVTGLSAESDAFWHDLFPLTSTPWGELLPRSSIEPIMTGLSPRPQGQLSLPVACRGAPEIDAPLGATGDKDSTESPPTEIIHQAVESLNGIVYMLPSHLTMQLETGDICNFGGSLNDYLGIFLARFPSVLSLIHKPTFKIGETAPSTLLLMLALGSNFLGTTEAITKGESLWKLAHAVATTCWSTLVTNRGPWDSCSGVQLVLTAALGQTYALMSRNHKLRTTAQVVHDLGFHWAQQCGMYDIDYSATQDGLAPLESRWRAWAASETQLRALLAHYILDGHMTQVSGESVCVRHSINPLPMPVIDSVFDAPDPHTWQAAMAASKPVHTTFREYILDLFRGERLSCATPLLSETSIFVVLECFQSFASERQEAGGDAIGLPSQREVTDAMTNFYRSQIMMQSPQEQNDQALRWHSILGFSVCTNIRNVCHQLCEVAGTPHPFFPPRKHGAPVARLEDILQRVNGQEGRMALLHSFAICDRISNLRLGYASGIHVPFAAFYAAVTMLAFLSTGSTIITAPVEVDWAGSAEDDETHGSPYGSQQPSSFVNGVSVDQGVVRNLQVEVHGLR